MFIVLCVCAPYKDMWALIKENCLLCTAHLILYFSDGGVNVYNPVVYMKRP